MVNNRKSELMTKKKVVRNFGG